ncbi:MAG TPA: VWA domain-containing protein [Candidatus Acidoferrales bacterium]|jgi:Mg-chelatase subunit ChlD|nr:VWA domain-containing protein [Candidatus Acidoferrales bacterium]
MLTLFQPVWLLLLIPVAAAWFAWPLPARGLKILRAVVLVLIVLALAQLAIKLPDRAGTVIVVADRSESMPANSDASEKEIIGLLHKSMGPRDQLGVIAFGRVPAVEQLPQRGEFGGFAAQVGTDHSSLNDAVESALSLIPADGGGRILVLSDGKWTGKDPAAAAARAAGRGVAVDFRLLARPQIGDVAIQSFLTPESVLPGQAFVLSAWVVAPTDQEIQYQLRRGDEIISSGSKQVSAGRTRLMFRDRASKAGVNEYVLTIQGAKDDPIPENNSARALVGVEGARPLLVVSSAGEASGLVKLLRKGSVEVVGKTPTQCQWSLEELSQFSAVLVENVPAGQIGMSGMETLASWVEETGSGLLMTGGQKSYGPGGYFKSPLERVLPISMEMRREHRKLSVAVVVALDRSGSMAMPAGGGRIKMDLADLGTVSVLDLLSPMDEIGVYAVDTTPHEIVPLDTVEHNISYRSKILAIGSEGGGIYIYEALVASAKMIQSAKAQTRHIILFADASDSEQSMHYEDIVDKLREADVTVSVVGLGTDHDCDANLLKDIAKRGGGQCYFSDNPDEIPRIFAQDTFTIARSTFIDQPTPFAFTAGFSLLGSQPVSPPPALGGYNLCYIRPEANLAAVTGDEYKAPVVASWNAGSGRVLCYLGEADGKYSGDFAHWDQAGEFYATLARWTAGKRQPLPDDMLLTQEIRDGVCFVQLHLDPERKSEPFSNLPRVHILHGLPGAAPAKDTVSLQWKNADLLEAAIPVAGRETILNTVEISGQQPVTLPAACLPYSPEFAPDQPGRGAATLAQIATTTGGTERIEIPKIWNELPIRPRYVELAPWLLVLGAILFLLEILERRTGWVSRLFGRKAVTAARAESEEAEAPAAIPAQKPAFPWLVRKPARKPTLPVTAAAKNPAAGSKAPAEAKPAPAKPPSAESTIDALRQARERAQRRTDKDR